MNTFKGLNDIRGVFHALLTGWPMHVTFDGRTRREVTIRGIRKVETNVADITGVLEGREIIMRTNINEHSVDCGSGAWRYANEQECEASVC